MPTDTGFAVGVAERARLPDPERVAAGDVLVGLPSNGLHSNGYSLVRKVVVGLDPAAEHGLGRPLGDVVLDPTRIYVRDLLPLFRDGLVKGAAHITGGGLPGNVPRMLPESLGVHIDARSWQIPPIFRLLEARGGLDMDDLLQTFNCGVGMVLAVAPGDVDAVLARTDGFRMGEVTAAPGVVVA